MKLAAFDLDNTLLAGDSDYLWGQYLADQGVVDAQEHARRNQEFYAQYQEGTLDIHEFARFSFGRMGRIPAADLARLRAAYVREIIMPRVAPGAHALLEQHRQDGAELLIITATNTYITRPIAELLGVPTLIGTEPAFAEGCMTGEIDGTPCFQDGKVTKLREWLKGREVERSWFYSDSINDVPLLEWSDHPHAVDPCPRLEAVANERGWPILSLR